MFWMNNPTIDMLAVGYIIQRFIYSELGHLLKGITLVI